MDSDVFETRLIYDLDYVWKTEFAALIHKIKLESRVQYVEKYFFYQ